MYGTHFLGLVQATNAYRVNMPDTKCLLSSANSPFNLVTKFVRTQLQSLANATSIQISRPETRTHQPATFLSVYLTSVVIQQDLAENLPLCECGRL